jgi:hypothetical protein
MKKIVILLAIIIFTGLSTNSFAQKDRRLSKGFSVNLVTGFPSSTYGTVKDADISDEFKLGGLWGIQIGNRWYFSPKEKYGIGLMVNWADISISAKGGTVRGIDWGKAVIDFTFLEIGPVGTYALTDKIALDAYYNLRPTVFSSAIVYTSPSGGEDITNAYAGFGISHAIGAAFRYKIFNVGLEYVMGGINSTGTTSEDDETLADEKIMTNSFRIMLGLKF